jgi:hypothetical protein
LGEVEIDRMAVEQRYAAVAVEIVDQRRLRRATRPDGEVERQVAGVDRNIGAGERDEAGRIEPVHLDGAAHHRRPAARLDLQRAGPGRAIDARRADGDAEIAFDDLDIEAEILDRHLADEELLRREIDVGVEEPERRKVDRLLG